MDRGSEFFADKVLKQLMTYVIKFSPNKPDSPHLNGKGECSQKTDKSEFYPTIDVLVGLEGLELAEWQRYYNWERPPQLVKGVNCYRQNYSDICSYSFV